MMKGLAQNNFKNWSKYGQVIANIQKKTEMNINRETETMILHKSVNTKKILVVNKTWEKKCIQTFH
jgi:hypothetical protein